MVCPLDLVRTKLTDSGFTPQFTGLEELNQKFGAKGLQVLGFPSNEFGSQDPGKSPSSPAEQINVESIDKQEPMRISDHSVNSITELHSH
jgi:glutathione peroxidase-family protein